MQCKYCGAELEEGNNVCPNCGEINEEKDFSKKLKVMKILTFCLAGLILVGALLTGINYGMTGRLLPGKNDVFYKASYSVSVEKLNTTAGNKAFQKNRDTVIASLGEYTLTNRMLQVYYWDLVTSSEYADMDSKTPLDQQYQDPDSQKTWQQFYIEKVIESWEQDALVLQMAKEKGFEMPEVYASQFETLKEDMTEAATSNGYTSLEAFVESMLGRGTTFETYYDYLWNYFLGRSYWAEYVKTVEVDMTDIEEYYEAHQSELVLNEYFQVTKDSGNLVDVRHILIKPEADIKDEDGKATGSSEDAWNACHDKAQAILDEWLTGEKTEDSFAKLATEKTEDGGSKTTGGLYSDVWPGMMVEAFNDWCFDESRESGDYGMVKTPYGYHIMYFVDAEEGWIRMCTSGAKSDKALEILDELAANTDVDVNYKKIAIAELD
ncbi:MAG: peptidylprolyl isomerase [Oscillospiraceae bacterium]|nr:peptidylprolyl isomerase [Oscillospiraceae bacterium]